MRNGLSRDLIVRVLGEAPKYTLDELEIMFPLRNLSEDALVTRVAPSPTGFMHLGTLYQMMIAKKLAQQSNGVFMLRIEDTDTKREVAGAVEVILKCAKSFNLIPDEGPEYGGKYGPYYQSQRKDVYHSVAAFLLEKGLAYPCFLTAEEMDTIREKQKTAGWATGIYGEWARDRELTEEEIISHLDNGEVPSIRLYSMGNKNNKIYYNDKVRGRLIFPENEEDIVLIKSNDRLPTYHFAHLCDDHFMRTTLVQRGEEWLSSLNLHLQLFRMMGWKNPEYIHVATINKLDEQTHNSRKLSKRTDPEANTMQYLINGFPQEAVLNYLYNIVAAGYEEEKAKKSETNIWNYPLRIKKIPTSSALFSTEKLEWWAKEYIATLSVDVLVKSVVDWAEEYGNENNKKQIANIDYLTSVLSIERDNPKRIRKDFITWKQTLEEVAYFWDDLFVANKEYSYNKDALNLFLNTWDFNDDKDTWWAKIVKISESLCVKPGEVAMNLRVAMSGRTNTPDLYSIMHVFGTDRVIERIKLVL
ncbi:MAG: glutamate--tRNA ligase [Alphaproteobacteria bacterium]|nr:glutamate--tRNA ligase [Alphaproteobacteria bacterium]